MHPPAALPRLTSPTGLKAPERPATDSTSPMVSGIQAPVRRIAAARNRYQTDGSTGLSGGRLLVALFQRLVRDLVGAETAIANHQIEAAHLQLVHAQDILDSLEGALDAESWDQADRMAGIYAHVRRELVRANITKNATLVARCRQIIEPLAATWQQALDLTSTTDAVATNAGLVAP